MIKFEKYYGFCGLILVIIALALILYYIQDQYIKHLKSEIPETYYNSIKIYIQNDPSLKNIVHSMLDDNIITITEYSTLVGLSQLKYEKETQTRLNKAKEDLKTYINQ
jgi:hypothetical protein